MTAIILTTDELARLQRDGELWKQVPTVSCPTCGDSDDPGEAICPATGCLTQCDPCGGRALVSDPAILAAAEPCETCGGDMHCSRPNCDGGHVCPAHCHDRKRIEVRVVAFGEEYTGEPVACGTVLAGSVSVAEVRAVGELNGGSYAFPSHVGNARALVGSHLARLTDWEAT